jgi:putative ABC transport system permease protein
MLAKLALDGFTPPGKFLPPMTVSWGTIALGVGIAILMGAASGLIPAWQARKLRIVDALRRVE